jgi:hypothetical protein
MARTKALQDDRFRLIWIFLLWEGQVGNARLRQVLDLETVQVSRLLSAFIEAYPRAASWDRSNKCYVATGLDAPRDAPSLDVYLSTLETFDVAADWLDQQTAFSLRPDARIFSAVNQACRCRGGLKIISASMCSPDGAEGLIYPQAMAKVGQRWIVRAWCGQRHSHVDFLLDQIMRCSTAPPLDQPPPADPAWEEKLELRLKAHDELQDDCAKLIRRQYFGGAVAARRNIRTALIPYYLQEMRIAVNPATECPPAFYLQVSNPEAVVPYVFPSIPQLK